jgi:hypothetical protein
MDAVIRIDFPQSPFMVFLKVVFTDGMLEMDKEKGSHQELFSSW